MADTKQTLKCPACEKQMQKIFMPKNGINIDICLDGCGGIFFDNREFQCFDDREENIDPIMNAIEGKTFVAVDTGIVRICPVCGAKMVKNYVSQKHQVMIDECYSCGGKFLDNKELQMTRNEYSSYEEKASETQAFVVDTISKFRDSEVEDRQAKTNRHPILKEIFDYVVDACDKEL